MAQELRLPNLNRITLAGYATSAAELRTTQGGTQVATFGLAYNYRYKSGDEWKSDANFFRCVAWAQRAEQARDRVFKGAGLLVEGRLQSREWEQDGQRRTAVEIVVDRLQVLSKQDSQREETDAPHPALDDDDVPF